MILTSSVALAATRRVSVRSNGTQGNGDSYEPSISADGNLVAFYSDATNLVPNDGNDASDVFVHNVATGRTRRVSIEDGGGEPNGDSVDPMISADGRFVVFTSDASDLVPNDNNGFADIFVRNLGNQNVRRVSVDMNGDDSNGSSSGPAISADGSVIGFTSVATDLVATDNNLARDAFVREAGTTELASVDSNEAQGLPNLSTNSIDISGDGNRVVFHTFADLDVNVLDNNGDDDIYLRNRSGGGTTELVSLDMNGQLADDYSAFPSISGNGQWVAFHSRASDLVANDTNLVEDVFLRDLVNDVTTRVSVRSNGDQAEAASFRPDVSRTGRRVGFHSSAANLVPNDDNDSNDVFVHDRVLGRTVRASVRSSGADRVGDSFGAALNASGQLCAFDSDARLVQADQGIFFDVFVSGPLF